jgi:hypothetical protein
MRVWLLVLALAGCDRVFGIGDPYEDAAAMVGGSDAMADAIGDDAAADAPAEKSDAIGEPEPPMLIRFPFDGDLRDSTGMTSATAPNGDLAKTTGGRFGGYVEVNGTQCIEFTLAAMPPQFSIVMWVETTGPVPGQEPLLVRPDVTVSQDNDWALLGSDTLMSFDMLETMEMFYEFQPGLSTNWQEFAVTFDGFMLRTYVNGAQATMSSATSPSYGIGTTVYLGCDGRGTANGQFVGRFDDVQIYGGPLTAGQVSYLYQHEVLP